MVANSSASPDGAALLPYEGVHECVHIHVPGLNLDLKPVGLGRAIQLCGLRPIMGPVLWCLEQQPEQSRSAQIDEWAYLGVTGEGCSSFWLETFFLIEYISFLLGFFCSVCF